MYYYKNRNMDYLKKAKYFKTKKRLGQNFLVSEEVIGDIIKLKRSAKYKNAEINHNENLYEKIVKNFPVIKNLFSENYITFFQKYYYKVELK